MKNLLKSGLLAIVIAICISACGDGDKAGSHPKIDTTKTVIDTAGKQIDTAKKDVVTTKADTTKKDTAKKP